ncbi:MAG: DUF4982 domain-containing protein [Puniceicoccales bacterium]|jgi:beta-galactosidase|nr:DUF4982 domain-containing protein [Puniceicoccales bacterium]
MPTHRPLVRPFFLFLLFLCGSLPSLLLAGEKLNFNADWRFIKEDVKDAEKTSTNDSSWQIVSAPHTFNDTDTFDDYATPKHEGERDQWSGRTWYRKSFDAPATWKGKKVFIEFEAVRQVAEVYLNGVLLGKSENGFLPFGFDLTPHLRPGEQNVLAVMCDNRFIADETGKNKWSAYEGGGKFPWNNPHWHPAHGGIYRNVFLHVTDPVHITLPLYSNLQTIGTYAYATEVSAESAKVGVQVEVINERLVPVSVAWASTIVDAKKKPVLRLNASADLAAGEKKVLSHERLLANPQLWDVDRPHLYTVYSELKVNGTIVDTVNTPLGIRFYKFTNDTGFHLNGRYVRLHGWGQKSTNEWAGLGAAFPDWMQYETLRLMREAGGNFVRWGHTAGGPAQITASDRLGQVVLQPGVDGEGDYKGHAWEVRAAAFRDLIIYYRNNPSIFIWEGGNQNVTKAHATELRGYMQQYDPHGGRLYAHRRPGDTCLPFLDMEVGTQGSHKYPQLPVVEGEYNRQESPRRVWDNFSPPDFGYKIPRKQEYHLTSEQFAVNQVIEYYSRIYRQGGKHCGGANWIFSDSTSGGRNTAEVTRASGEVDAVRLPKEAYYACRAMFRNDPQVHIIGHWSYPADRETTKDVFVVSNAAQVELRLNGKSLGVAKPTQRFLFTFKKVTWAPGRLEAVASDSTGKVVATHALETIGPAVALKLTPITGPSGWQGDGSDILLVDVEAVDVEGRRCPTVQQRVDFTLTGPAIWRGGYNSGKEKSTNNTWLDLEAGVNRVAIRSTHDEGKIILAVRSAGLKDATLRVPLNFVALQNGCLPALPEMPMPELPDALPAASEFDAPLPVIPELSGKYIQGFSYSGESSDVRIVPAAANGLPAYADTEGAKLTFVDLPSTIQGAEFVQLPFSERLYQAVDLMDFKVSAAGTLYIAYDPNIPLPAWTKPFKNTGEKIKVGEREMILLSRSVSKNQSLTLGSNRESGPEDCLLYVVFFVKK